MWRRVRVVRISILLRVQILNIISYIVSLPLCENSFFFIYANFSQTSRVSSQDKHLWEISKCNNHKSVIWNPFLFKTLFSNHYCTWFCWKHKIKSFKKFESQNSRVINNRKNVSVSFIVVLIGRFIRSNFNILLIEVNIDQIVADISLILLDCSDVFLLFWSSSCFVIRKSFEDKGSRVGWSSQTSFIDHFSLIF